MLKALVIGFLGRDAAVNNVSGKTVINFAVAHTERYKDAQGNQRDKTTWVDCSYWTERTGIAPYLKKGTQVYVEGQPDVRAYTNKEGSISATLVLRVGSIQLLGSKTSDGAAASANNQPLSSVPSAYPAADNTEVVDDLPF